MAIQPPGMPGRGKFPPDLVVMIRGPANEFPATVVDLTTSVIEVKSKFRLPPNERVGVTISTKPIRITGVSIPGEVRRIREEPGFVYSARIDFSHSGDSEKRLRTFLWEMTQPPPKKPPPAKPGGPSPFGGRR